MDTDVLQNIDLFPVTNNKAIDSLLDNSPNCLKQFSDISFWDNFANQVTINGTDYTKAAQVPKVTTTELTKNSPKRSPKPIKKTLKRAHTPDHKRSKLSQDSSALDCCDYWLRFDSDDDSLERLGDFDHQAVSAARRPLNSFQQATRLGRVGQPGSFKLELPSRTDDWLEDSALEHALSSEEDTYSMAMDDEFATRDTNQAQDIAPERLYSTPLSWDAPQPGVRNESYFNINPAFNDPERQRLLAIAMGSGLTQMPSESRPSVDFTFDMHPSPSATSDTTSNGPPEPKRRASFVVNSAKTSRSNSRSGLITPGEPNDSTMKKEKPRNSDRAAHNDIERKYRTNLKDRIADLREAIPSLRSIPEDYDDDGSPVPVSRAPKVSKGTILTKATEYIHQLERRNRSMSHKNEELLRRLQAFEQLLGASPAPATWQPQGYGAAVFNPAARFSS
ncbi:hypothetical protein BKA67DRAFT_662518 [Truncatella angustata]|uniref:BHLH domain-containing protein n=1 Tax=Truncatella angustata TaxID=152316 RepID=A0A9P8RQS4_9PEZI|nr:uncharacterized protein BKA67DRAFT_662518 [Truncatella angustata]KAH6647757.1 hypothetical protein BKA67DRAFT_662518 [Truncatella angustata]KAH8204450.1 hypothetical protein TruAng_001366 [Truncatella angustata]